MRKTSPERPKADRLVGSKEDSRDELALVKGKEKKKNKKKVLKGNKVAVRNDAQKEENTASLTSKQEKQAAPDLLSNPEAKGRGVINDDRPGTESMPRLKTTSRGGVPDRRCRILKVVIVRRLKTWVLGIWRGEGLGNGLGKGRSVYKQPETEVDGSRHS
jgi:hypothetical protein